MWTPACCEVLEDFDTFQALVSGSFGNSGQLATQDLKLSCATNCIALICRGLRYGPVSHLFRHYLDLVLSMAKLLRIFGENKGHESVHIYSNLVQKKLSECSGLQYLTKTGSN